MRVTSGSDANAEPVAEFTLAAILFANKDVFWRRDELRQPALRRQRHRGGHPVGNFAKSIGIVGASLIGRRVHQAAQWPSPTWASRSTTRSSRAKRPSTSASPKLELDELCAAADVLSIHAPDLPSTHHLIGAGQLAALHTGATVINTARGALIDHVALVTELEAGRLTAVLDVTDPGAAPPKATRCAPCPTCT